MNTIHCFHPSAIFKQTYDNLFEENPYKANMFLLLCELADENGQVVFEDNGKEDAVDQIVSLMYARFNDPNKDYGLQSYV
jgi:hypothetical protein